MSERAEPGRLFGTDGIRGTFSVAPLDRDTITRVGFCLGRRLAETAGEDASVVIAGDTRSSTPEIGQWLATGLGAHGVTIRYGGVLPTPAVAFLCRDLGTGAGIAISASHNPFPDNGVKLFDGSGFKWDVAAEQQLEEEIRDLALDQTLDERELSPSDASLGDAYLEMLGSALEDGGSLQGLKIALDTANGSAAPWAETLFTRHGAQVQVVGDTPDGRNINEGCGSTQPQGVADLSLASGADLGVAFDGDADRAILVDEKGKIRDGDDILYVMARYLLDQGELVPPEIVATVMSNIGLEISLREAGIGVVRCDVGDRVVVGTMRDRGTRLGGEQSGHIVDLDRSTTGDGLLTALMVAKLVGQSGRPLSELAAGLEICPQILVNVPVRERRPFSEMSSVASAEAEIARQLGENGRLLLRYSGTEPLARIMLEGQDPTEIEAMGERLANLIDREIGATSNPS